MSYSGLISDDLFGVTSYLCNTQGQTRHIITATGAGISYRYTPLGGCGNAEPMLQEPSSSNTLQDGTITIGTYYVP